METPRCWRCYQCVMFDKPRKAKKQVEIVQEVTKGGSSKANRMTPCVLDTGMDLQDLMFVLMDFCLVLVCWILAILVLLPLGMEMFTCCHFHPLTLFIYLFFYLLIYLFILQSSQLRVCPEFQKRLWTWTQQAV